MERPKSQLIINYDYAERPKRKVYKEQKILYEQKNFKENLV